ncbi:MAG TPA: arylsulfatase [Chryseolinea sp.]|nr:arylsulfatase [Chryseolinea sp.]
MNWRFNLIWIILGLVFIQCQTPVRNEVPPNVIFILADDLGYGDLSCYGQTKFHTPNIDQLAKAGLVFTQHYSGSTVCAPSRSALLTGLHTGHTMIRGNKEVAPEGQYPLPDSVFTIVKQFKSNGYATGMFGKWGLGFPGSPGDPLNQGFDSFMGYNCQRLAHNYYPPYLWHDSGRLDIEENVGEKNGAYAPDLIHKYALQFIESNKSKPFFLYLPSVLPHAELSAPEKLMKTNRGKFGKETPYQGTERTDKNFKTGGYSSQSEPRTAFASMINVLDDHVGEIIRKLKDLNIYDNTIIVFTSDNGPHREGGADPDFFDSNGMLKGYKRDLYEGGIRVPLIVHWPAKVKAGKTDHVSAFWDFMPTFSELIGATPVVSDGISFAPTLLGFPDVQQKHKYLYWEFHEQNGKQAVRKGKWKAVKVNADSEEPVIELYDLENDPSEENNLATVFPDSVVMLRSLMEKSHLPNPAFPFSSEKN